MIPPELMAAVQSGGAVLSPFLLLLWWFERTDRKELQTRLDDLSVETIKVVTVMQATLQSVKDALFSGSRGKS